MAQPVVESGNYLFEVDTGFDYGSFRLDDAVKGVIGNTTYTLGPNASFADLTEYATSITYRRGRRRTVEQSGAATMTVVVDDKLAAGILNPLDDGSPYYDHEDDFFRLEPGRQVRLARMDGATPEYLFVGTINTYDYKYQLRGDNQVSIQCVDDFYKLTQAKINELNVDAETSGERITTVLDLPEVDLFDAVERDIADGTVNLGHSAPYTVPAGTVALTYLNQINQTAEGGRLFMSRDGVFTFQERIGSTLSAPVVQFSNDGVLTPYNDLSVEYAGDNVINRQTVTGLDDTTYTAEDAESVADYGYRTGHMSNSLLHDAAEIQEYAEYLLEPWPSTIYTSIQTSLPSCTEAQKDAVALVDIGDTVEITATLPGTATNVTQELAVEGIEGVIEFRRGHTIRFYTSPTTIVYLLLLDDAVYGKLDSDNVLG
jgi:hypothetical protein